jgi:hypothetical protein
MAGIDVFKASKFCDSSDDGDGPIQFGVRVENSAFKRKKCIEGGDVELYADQEGLMLCTGCRKKRDGFRVTISRGKT